MRLSFRATVSLFLFLAGRYHRRISRGPYTYETSAKVTVKAPKAVRLPFDTTSHVKTMGVLSGDHIWASSTKAKISPNPISSPFSLLPHGKSGCNIYMCMFEIYESPMSPLYIEMMTVKPRYGRAINISGDLSHGYALLRFVCPHFIKYPLLLPLISLKFSRKFSHLFIYLSLSFLFSRWQVPPAFLPEVAWKIVPLF